MVPPIFARNCFLLKFVHTMKLVVKSVPVISRPSSLWIYNVKVLWEVTFSRWNLILFILAGFNSWLCFIFCSVIGWHNYIICMIIYLFICRDLCQILNLDSCAVSELDLFAKTGSVIGISLACLCLSCVIQV